MALFRDQFGKYRPLRGLVFSTPVLIDDEWRIQFYMKPDLCDGELQRLSFESFSSFEEADAFLDELLSN